MSSYVEKCPKPIPIGKQNFAYQCENVIFNPKHKGIEVFGCIPHNGGKEPYPNPEADKIEHYRLEMMKFTSNSIELTLTKRFKDGSEEVYTTNTSFSILANLLFEGGPANVFKHDPAPHKPQP